MEEFEIVAGVLKRYHETEGKTDIFIPENVTKIAVAAFKVCTELTNITLPKSVIEIGSFAFYQCESLTTVTLPKSITITGEKIFSYCHKLINVNTSRQVFKKLCYNDQHLVISNFIRQYNTNNIYTKDEINRYKNFIILTKEKLLSILTAELRFEEKKGRTFYIRRSEAKVIEDFIKDYILPIIKNKPLLYFVCYNMDNAFTVNELDELIKLSVKIGEVEITSLLLEYKNKYFGYANPLDEYNLDDNKTK